MSASSASRLDLYWNPKQTEFLQCTDPFVDYEGGVRAGKSTALCWKIFFYCVDYPGIICALTRWTEDGLDAQVKPLWRSVCRQAGVKVTWNPREEYDEFPNGSRVYLRALKAGEETQRYGKLAGIGLAVLAIDQAEEVPEDVYRGYVPARLSQRFKLGTEEPVVHKDTGEPAPHQVLLTPNPPPDDNSWICREWPADGTRDGWKYIHTTLYDNRGPLGSAYIELVELGYERGTSDFRRFILGERGLTTDGDPVFGELFDEQRHVRTVRFDDRVYLCESWDYGEIHPCVTWCQWWPGGVFAVLGGVMGERLALDEFIPIVEEYRASWFPGLSADLLQWTCDPAGSIGNAQGSARGIEILRERGIYPLVKKDANVPPVRAAAHQRIKTYLRRQRQIVGDDGKISTAPCFVLDPRFVVASRKGRKHQPVIQRLFDGGYVYDRKRNYLGTTYPHLRPPKKDGWFEHPADSLSYNVIAFEPPDAASQAGVFYTDEEKARFERQAARERERHERRIREVDTVEIEHERMMRERMRDQPGYGRGRRGYFGSRRSGSGYGGLSRGGI